MKSLPLGTSEDMEVRVGPEGVSEAEAGVGGQEGEGTGVRAGAREATVLLIVCVDFFRYINIVYVKMYKNSKIYLIYKKKKNL
jgi:hypothetical protein